MIEVASLRYDHYDSFLHYHCTALLEQISSSANYKPNMQVFTIVVLTLSDKHKTDISITDFEPKKLDGTGIGETQHKIIYVCPKYATDETPEPYREWLKAIDDSLDEQVEESDYHKDIIQEIFALIKKDKITPQRICKNEKSIFRRRILKGKNTRSKTGNC